MWTNNFASSKSVHAINTPTPEDMQSLYSNTQSDQINNMYSKSAI